MLILGMTERDGGVNIAESFKKARSHAIYLLHTDQIRAAAAVIVHDQRKTVGKGLVKKDIAGHDANVCFGSAGCKLRHDGTPFVKADGFPLAYYSIFFRLKTLTKATNIRGQFWFC